MTDRRNPERIVVNVASQWAIREAAIVLMEEHKYSTDRFAAVLRELSAADYQGAVDIFESEFADVARLRAL